MAEQNNLPAKIEKKEESLFDEVKGEMLASAAQAIIPKIIPFVEPAMDEFDKYLGDNDKLILIRKIKDCPSMVIILDNNKGGYTIEMDKSQGVEIFDVDEEAVNATYGVREFIEKLFSGELIKEMKNKK